MNFEDESKRKGIIWKVSKAICFLELVALMVLVPSSEISDCRISYGQRNYVSECGDGGMTYIRYQK